MYMIIYCVMRREGQGFMQSLQRNAADSFHGGQSRAVYYVRLWTDSRERENTTRN